METERKKLDYVIDEYRNLIEETKMQINVVKQNYKHDIESMLKITNELENKIKSLEKGILKPYFARIDFKAEDEENNNVCYIGKLGVINNDDKIITVDWRAPISSLYYDSNIGKCSYVAPVGEIQGELLLKRKYNIENSNLISFNDVDIVSNDEILKPYLDVNSDNRLKNIVASIQSEQNQIIRRKMDKNIIVQGVAGSGKTTVALHRIAYLVYNNRKLIEPSQYMVIGPNKFFINYISSVLPDLDVNGVKQFDFIELAKEFISEEFIVIDNDDNESTYYKTSLKYKDIIDSYVNDLNNKIVPDMDLNMYGFSIMKKEHISDIYNNIEDRYQSIISKVERCILLLEKEISENAEKLILKANKYIDELYESEKSSSRKKELIKQREEIKKEIKNNYHNLLKKYFNIVNDKILYLYSNLLDNISKYIDNELILNYLKIDSKLIKNKKIEYEDLAALMYLKYKINGNENYINYRHVVIDESQDYNEFIFYTFKNIFKKATFSIFGDLAQSIYPYRSIENWNIIKEKIMDLDILNLSKSYRTSIEIMNEANKINKFLNLNEAVPVIRHGSKPEYYKIENNEFILNKVYELIKNGNKTIAIISKYEKDSNDIYNYLNDKIDITNINDSSNEYNGGICTITSSLCKGLEFDAVIINKADEEIFDSNNRTDMKLLYVSMTRPLHQLIITYRNKLSIVL